MAVSSIFSISKTPLSFRSTLVLCSRRPRRRLSTAAVETLPADHHPTFPPSKQQGDGGPQWTTFTLKELGIKKSMIAKPACKVLNGLRERGFEVYLVGGCVRDLILKRTPKDFDILTTADLREVKQAFSRCDIVGKRFPICHVHVNDYVVEVSSFKTHGRRSVSEGNCSSSRPHGCDEHDHLRWRNCLERDFTINGLMLNPYENLVYDYLGGMEDLKKAKVRTVKDAYISFDEDCARILRAIRIAARLGFRFSKETAHSIKDQAKNVLRLDKGRILMEMNYMLAYGSAEASLRLLWRFGLLELLLPIQASYFVSQGFCRRDERSNMLLALLSNLDKLLAPDKPCHGSLWVGVLAFHQALWLQPRDPLVVAAFTIALYTGGDMSLAVDIARSCPFDAKFPELLKPREWDADCKLMNAVQDLSASVNAALSSMVDEYYVSRAMAKYPQAPYSGLVFIPLPVYLRTRKIFDCVGSRDNVRFSPHGEINYSTLPQGSLAELRRVFGQVVFDTVYPPNREEYNI